MQCTTCGTMVPADNMTLHQLRCSQRSRRRSESTPARAPARPRRATSHAVPQMRSALHRRTNARRETAAVEVADIARDDLFSFTPSQRSTRSDNWICQACTFSNLATHLSCEVCGSERQSQLDQWSCLTCTFRNPGQSVNCEMCSAARAPAAAPAAAAAADAAAAAAFAAAEDNCEAEDHGDSRTQQVAWPEFLENSQTEAWLENATGPPEYAVVASKVLERVPLWKGKPGHSPKEEVPNGTSIQIVRRHAKWTEILHRGQLHYVLQNYIRTDDTGSVDSATSSTDFSSGNIDSSSQDDEDCCLFCFEEYGDPAKCMALPCGHRMHISCADPWLIKHGNCPTCRHPLDHAAELVRE
eukprot:TRINITY_DN9315_c0_g1_i1.p1 TRINITY_DN9315_c0_g1~~TRINITY_DN9315_c0_g1_i1.p1  ORF type:complete len:356 (-),score=61.18 TRINITY_DN9315_c0_g1_i1:236-1303(-)